MSRKTRSGAPWSLALGLVLGVAASAPPALAAATCLGVGLTLPAGTLTGTAGNDVR
jgi:hypothetical protein